MKRMSIVGAIGLALACGDSSGPGPSPWIGVWDVQVTNAAGYAYSPAATVVSFTDSSGKVLATMPATGIVDSANAEYMGFPQAFSMLNVAGRRDSIDVGASGTGINYSFHYRWYLIGTSNGATASGSVVVEIVELASSGVIGTWTAVKR